MNTPESEIKKLPRDLAVVVPAYNAGSLVAGVIERLEPYVHRICLVDDGSTDGCTDGLESDVTHVLTLPNNNGKGYALLKGYAYLLDDESLQCVAVLDADGQHDEKDLPRLYRAFGDEKADFLIGARNFDEGYVPFRSRVGNKVTKVVSAFMLGANLPDTQSGYRLISRRYLEQELEGIPGGRYETEMQMIAIAIRGEYTLASEPIRTIYEKGNHSSHFNILRDSFLIYRKLISIWLGNIVRK